MAHHLPSPSPTCLPPTGATRRDYSTPLPFTYAKQPTRTLHSTPHVAEGDEDQYYISQSNSVQPASSRQTRQEGPPPWEHNSRQSQPEPEAQRTVQQSSLMTVPPKPALMDGSSREESESAPTLNFSRPNLRSVPDSSRSTNTGFGRVFRDGVMHQMKRKGGVDYELVDGVSMDTHPASSTSTYGSNEPIPEIEARDINEIMVEPEHAYPPHDGDETQPSPAHSSHSSSSDGDQNLSPQWSGTSDSTSATSPSGASAVQDDPAAISPALVSRSIHNRDTVNLPVDPVVPPPSEAATPYAHAEGTRLAASCIGRKIELGVIKEEDSESLSNGQNLGAAPCPAVKGVKDEETVHHPALKHLLPSGMKARKHAESNHSPSRGTESRETPRPPRVLVGPGIGDDQHVYELEAANTQDTSDPSSPSRNGTMSETVAGSTSSDSSGGTDMAGAIHQKLSKAAHAIEEKVKKSVSFSPVEDVRFLTPSPSRLGEGTRREANQAYRNKLR